MKFLFRLGPVEMTILGFLLLIIVGTGLLLLPMSTPAGESLSFTDAFFTATSAVCVTGLIVKDTATDFTVFGQVVIMLLFQSGGIGIILGSSLFILGIKGSLRLGHRLALQESFVNWPLAKIRKSLYQVFLIFFLVEAVGAILLAFGFMDRMSGIEALWHGLFHSISAVCNAGFSLNSSSFIGYQSDPLIVLTLSGLIIFGGLGFVVIAELITQDRKRFSLHSRTMLLGTTGLIGFGFLFFAFLEPSSNLWTWLFQSVTARTAGFNTVDLATWGSPALLLMMLLMFIGAGPASTAGGIKITTFVTVLSDLWSKIRYQKNVHWLSRRLPGKLVSDSVVLFAMAFFVGGLFIFMLSITETAGLQVVMFEVFSALGTVGLSLGITPELSTPGKWIIIMAMFFGRLGPLTFVYLFVQKSRELYTYPEERMVIG